MVPQVLKMAAGTTQRLVKYHLALWDLFLVGLAGPRELLELYKGCEESAGFETMESASRISWNLEAIYLCIPIGGDSCPA